MTKEGNVGKCNVFKGRKTNISEDMVEKEKYMENGDWPQKFTELIHSA